MIQGGLVTHVDAGGELAVEDFFSLLKRGLIGTYHHCSAKHLQRYVTEFDFRYNNRSRLGIEDQERADLALQGIVGKRLTYRPPLSEVASGEA